MTVNELIEKSSFNAVCVPSGEHEVSGAYTGDLLSWVMGNSEADNVWITIMTNQNIIAVASLIDLSCIVICEGSEIDAELVKTAEEKGINILSSPKSAYQTCVELSGIL